LGGAIGAVLAILGSGVVESILKTILPYAPTGKLVLITPLLLIGSFIGALLVGFLSGIYPAWRAALMQPVKAIRIGE